MFPTPDIWACNGFLVDCTQRCWEYNSDSAICIVVLKIMQTITIMSSNNKFFYEDVVYFR